MRKYVGNALMVGLALLLGCNQAPQHSYPGPRYYPGGGVASAPIASPAAQPNWRDGPGVLPQPVAPNMNLPPARLSPPPETLPEVSSMRIYARQPAVPPPANVVSSVAPHPAPPRSLPPQPLPPMPTPKPGPAQTLPEVVLLGVGGEAPRRTPRASESRTVTTASKPEAVLLAPELQSAPTEPAPLPTPPANPGFAHAPDYGWLTGELEHIQAKNVWRLRYAAADQEDRYGGAVQLVGDSLPPGCKSGQIVRIEGQVVNPDAGPRPPYWVRSLRLLKEAPAEQE